MGAELAGRTAVVTGASKGIGLAVVNALAASGARVVAGARRTSPELAELAKAGQVKAVEVDLASPAALRTWSRRRGSASTSWSTTSAVPRRGPAAFFPSPTRTGWLRSTST